MLSLDDTHLYSVPETFVELEQPRRVRRRDVAVALVVVEQPHHGQVETRHVHDGLLDVFGVWLIELIEHIGRSRLDLQPNSDEWFLVL